MTEIPAAVEAELARLRAENARLLRLLKMTSKQAGPIWASAGAFFDAPPGLINDWSLPDVKVAFFGTVQRLIAKGEASMWLEPSPDGCDRCL